jgi:hypothetical protein
MCFRASWLNTLHVTFTIPRYRLECWYRPVQKLCIDWYYWSIHGYLFAYVLVNYKVTTFPLEIYKKVAYFASSCNMIYCSWQYSSILVQYPYNIKNIMCFRTSCVFVRHGTKTHDARKHMMYENTWRTKTHDARKHMTYLCHVLSYVMCFRTSCVFLRHVFSYIMCFRASYVFVRHGFSCVMYFRASCVFTHENILRTKTHDVRKHMTHENTWRSKTRDARKYMMHENTWRTKTYDVLFSYVMGFRASCIFVRHVFSCVMCFRASCVFVHHVFSYVMYFRASCVLISL